MNTITKVILSAAALLITTGAAAQTNDNPVVDTSQAEILLGMTADEYSRIQLPSLHKLMENARSRSPQVNVYDANREIEERELKTVRRTWLKYIKLNASYSYGSNDTYTEQSQNNQYPIIQSVSGIEQSWWNVGANFSLPLDEIFNRSNRIKQQKKKIESIQYEADRWYDDVCLKIIESYTIVIQNLSLLSISSEAMVIARAQYDFSKTDFINGKIDARELSRQKSIETSAVREYQEIRAELNKALLQLEVLSKTRIITPPNQSPE